MKPKFLIANTLSVEVRMVLIAASAVIGITIQSVSGFELDWSFAVGWVFVLVAALLLCIKDASNKPKLKSKEEWREVTYEELESALEMSKRSQGISRNSCLANLGGCLFLFALLVVGLMIFRLLTGLLNPNSGLTSPDESPLLQVLIIDGFTLFLPLIVAGRVVAWQPPHLAMRINQLMHIHRLSDSWPQLEFHYSMLLANTKSGAVPMDCRLLVKFRDSDEDFIGVQVQTTLNSVESKKFPYTYCILVAKPLFYLIDRCKEIVQKPPSGGFKTGVAADKNAKKEAKLARFKSQLVELKKEADMEIAVVRQPTSGRGYTTDLTQTEEVFVTAIELAEKALKM